MFRNDKAQKVETLGSQVALLDASVNKHQQNHRDAAERKAQLEARRRELLIQIAEKNSGHHDLEKLDEQLRHESQSVEAFTAAVRETTAQLASTKKRLERAVEDAAIDQLEAEMRSFGERAAEIEDALRVVAAKSTGLFAAIDKMAAQLLARDEKRFGRTGQDIASLVQRGLWIYIQQLGKPNVKPTFDFMTSAAPTLRRLIAQLRYEALEGDVRAGRGEKLYRATANIGGLRDVDLNPNQLVALRPEEAVQFLRDRSVEEVATEQVA